LPWKKVIISKSIEIHESQEISIDKNRFLDFFRPNDTHFDSKNVFGRQSKAKFLAETNTDIIMKHLSKFSVLARLRKNSCQIRLYRAEPQIQS
jgi:hypothetical protein